MVELASLPAPQVIEEIDFEAIVARQKATFASLWEAVRIANPDLNLPTYDVAILETDPAILIIEEESYREMLLRARANDVAKSNLLKHSTGADLDNLAADHGVERLVGESDAALRQRIVLADQGRSAAGPEEWYAFHARSVSAEVRDVAVYRTGAGPELEVAILSTDEGGVPSDVLLSAVAAKVTSAAVRSINDIVTVVAGTKTIVDVIADIWLLPDTPVSVFDDLEAGLRDALDAEGGFGFDINDAWLKAKLMTSGVSKVVISAPAADVKISDSSAATFGDIALTYKGRNR